MSLTATREPAHQAASQTDARLAGWIPSPGSADADLLPELARIRPRTRDIARNSGLACGYIQTSKDNIIGHQLRLMAMPDYRLLGRDKDWAREWSLQTEAEFRTWADTTECDAGRRQNLLGQSNLMLSGAFLNGDALALPLWLPRPGQRWSTRLQIIEADRLSDPPYLQNYPNLRKGVQIDDHNAPVRYHFQKNHPGDRYGLAYTAAPEWESVPAFTPWGRRRVLHLYDQDRAGQSRGKPIMTAVLREFRISGEYLGHELQAAATNALIAAFLESDLDPQTTSELFGPDVGAAGDYWQAVGEKYHRKRMEGGLMMQLPIGARLSGYNPNRPNTAFDGFMESVMRHLSAGLNIPYELLLKDFSKTNYSSARAALLEAWRYFLGRRRWLRDHWLAPIYELWLEEAVNLGRVEAPDFYEHRYAWCRQRWIFAGRGWVDPVKEATAAQIRLESGLSTLETECAEQGLDWEEVLDQQAVEMQRRRDLGLPDSYGTAGRGFPAPTEPDQGVSP